MKFYKEIVRKYYKWTDYVSFARANITANNGFVATSTTGYITGYSFFQGNSLVTGNTDAPYPTFTLKIPYGKFRISSIYNYISSNGKGVNSWDIYKNGEKIERITFSQQGQTINLTNPIELLPQDVFSITAVGYASYGGTWTSFYTQCNFENCELVEGTESDYDFYKDVEVQKVIQKNVRKYYNYVDEPFVQPYLTSNGTMGGDKFAASAITEYSSSYQAYMAFDNSTSTEWASKGTQNPSWISFYNPEPLKVTKLTMRNRTSAENFTAGKIYGSNNNYYWEEIGSYSTTVTSANATWEIDLSNNTKYYKYYKIVGTSMTGTNQGFTNIAITAVYQNPVAEPSSFQPEFIERKYYKYDTANPVSNVNITGTLTNDNGVLSGFSSGNFAKLPNIFSHGSKPWEVQFKVTTGSNVSSQSCIYEQLYDGNVYYGLTLYIENNTLRVRCGNGSTFWNVNTDYSISANTAYWIKAVFNGTQYILSASIDGENWTTASTITSSTIAYDNYLMFIGRRNYGSNYNQWLGSIDLKESYIKVNNELWWEGVTYPVIDGIEQDFDFYKDVYNYEFYKDLDVYYAFRSYEKGEQYYGGI